MTSAKGSDERRVTSEADASRKTCAEAGRAASVAGKTDAPDRATKADASAKAHVTTADSRAATPDKAGNTSQAGTPGKTSSATSTATLRAVLRGVVRSNRALTLALVAIVAADVALALVPPLVLEGVVNDLAAGRTVALAAALLYFGAVAASSVLDSLKSASVTVAGQKVTHGLRSAMAEKLDRLPARYFTSHTGGAVSSLFVNDVDTVRALFDEGIVSMVVDACKVVGIVAVVFTRSVGLGVLLVVVTPFLFLLTRAFQRRMLAAQLANRTAIAQMNAQVPETVRTIRTVRNLGRERFMEQRYDASIRDCFTSMEHVNLYDSVYSPIIVTTGSVVIAAVMVLASLGGGVQEFFGMSVGTAAAVIAYVGKVFEPLGAIGMEIENIQQAVAGVKRVQAFLGEEERGNVSERPDGGAPLAVELAMVDFGYEDGRPVLRDFSLAVAPGEMVTLAGRTGAGKSTVFKLIMGDYEPQAGSVRVWGVDASKLSPQVRRRFVGHVDQSFKAVPGTLGDQIALGDPAISREETQAAAQLAGIAGAIEALPQGYDTPYTDGLLSQGQVQLLSIARAVAANPKLLLLDEITANLDSGTEAQVMEALERAGRNRAVLSISHRLYTQSHQGRLVQL